MPVFNYVAKDVLGNTVKGSQSADSRNALYSSLRQRGLTVTQANEAGLNMNISIDLFEGASVKDVAVFCRQFATILKAGVPVLKSVDILRAQTENKFMKKTLTNVYEDLQKGNLLSEAMQKHKKVFPAILVNMVQAGEISGTLDGSLEKMAVHFEKEFKLKKKVQGAMTYPIVISVVALIAVVVLLTFVVPQFANMFSDLGSKLPWTTQFLLDTGNFMKSNFVVVIAVLVLLVGGVIYFKGTPAGKRFFDKMALTLPIFSGVTRKVVSARFTRTLSTMLAAGIPMIKSLESAERVVENTFVEESLKKVKEDVMKGGGLAEPIAQTGYFPVMVYQMVKIGEESGSIDEMLLKTADFYDEEVDAAISAMTTMIEPLILMVMAVVVGFIVISIVQPMFGMYSIIK